MNINTKKITVLLIVILWSAPGLQLLSQSKDLNANPLEPFTQLIGGEWHLEGSYQVFEWGVGKKSIISKSYFIIDEKPQLVSEGTWFWHPGIEKVKGYFTAVMMPAELFDYTSYFENDMMVSELITYDQAGKKSNYLETWQFIDNDHYIWTLFTSNNGDKQKLMGGEFTRKMN